MWDERYREPGFAYGTAPNDFLVEAMRFLPKAGRVLSLAEGEGRNAVFLARLGYEVTAVDSSRVGLEKAQRLAQEQSVRLHTVVADLAHFPIEPDYWDVIVSIWCHVPSALRARLYPACARALRPQGVIVLESYTPEQLGLRTGGPTDADRLVALDELRVLLQGLEFLHACELQREVHEGKFHAGTSAVVQVVARKA